MKKLILRLFPFAAVGVLLLVTLLAISYKKALDVEKQVLIPNLSPSLHYNRVMHLRLFDPWVSILPHWSISYFENPINLDSDSPGIAVGIFGSVVDWCSKDVWGELVAKGYIKS
jgi:hypothetical protein